MSLPTTSKIKSIKDVQFMDGRIWIHGTVKSYDGMRLEIADTTGKIAMDLAKDNGPDVEGGPTVVKGKLGPGSFVRVIGNVIPKTDKSFTFAPAIILNLDELGVDKELLFKVLDFEQKIGGDK